MDNLDQKEQCVLLEDRGLNDGDSRRITSSVEVADNIKRRTPSNLSLNKKRMDKTANEKAALSFVLRQITFAYTLLVTSVCLATTLYYTVTRVSSNKPYAYEIIYAILFIASIIVLIYLFIFVTQNRDQLDDRDETQVELDTIGSRLSSTQNSSVTKHIPRLYHGEEGFNLYLRLGLVLFTVFGVVYNIVRFITEVTENYAVCGHALYIVFVFLETIFISMQTVFILMYHKVVFLWNKPLIRMCLSHLLLTNICLWIHSGIGEISEGVNAVLTKGEGTEEMNDTKCDKESSPAALVRPYMLPALIEYSLLAAPMLYELLQRVGKTEELSKPEDNQEEKSKYPPLHKAKRGAGFGIAALILCVVSILCFYVLSGNSAIAGIAIYHVEDTVFNAIIIACGCLAYFRLRELKFKRHTEGSVDENILWLALFGTIVYHVIILAKSVDTLSSVDNLDTTSRAFTVIEMLMSLLTITSCSLQAVIIVDAMHRVPEQFSHVDKKPGRPFITTLLFINFCLWILDTFEVKKSEVAFSVAKHKSVSPHEGINVGTSTALLYIVLPLVILFRFHSSVCLSSIWSKSYDLERF